jgi:hypothetical protein
MRLKTSRKHIEVCPATAPSTSFRLLGAKVNYFFVYVFDSHIASLIDSPRIDVDDAIQEMPDQVRTYLEDELAYFQSGR